jgi:hypothetical protein
MKSRIYPALVLIILMSLIQSCKSRSSSESSALRGDFFSNVGIKSTFLLNSNQPDQEPLFFEALIKCLNQNSTRSEIVKINYFNGIVKSRSKSRVSLRGSVGVTRRVVRGVLPFFYSERYVPELFGELDVEITRD